MKNEELNSPTVEEENIVDTRKRKDPPSEAQHDSKRQRVEEIFVEGGGNVMCPSLNVETSKL